MTASAGSSTRARPRSKRAARSRPTRPSSRPTRRWPRWSRKSTRPPSRYVKTPVGETDFRMTTYFADVGDVSALAVVNQAQADYVTTLRQDQPAPVRQPAGAVDGGAVQERLRPARPTLPTWRPGRLALNNAADLYLYPNTLYAVKVNGAGAQGLAGALGHALQYHRPGPQAEPQELVNPGRIRAYNFDTPTSQRRALRDRRHAAGGRAHRQLALPRQAGRRRRRSSWSRPTTTAPAAAAASRGSTAARP